MTNYVLQHPICETCVHSRGGFYNPICAHCPYCIYSKSSESSYATEEILRFITDIKERSNDDTEKKKLIELIHEFGFSGYEMNDLADYLLANGVVVLPCRCGECAYHTLEEPGSVYCPYVIGGWVFNDGFCSGAKRKGGDERCG